MFVTSDIFDLPRIARYRGIAGWREHLIGGVAIHGTDYRGPEALASFYVEAARLCGLTDDMMWASYTPRWRERSRPLKPASLLRLAKGELRGARAAIGILMRGVREAPGADQGKIIIGGAGSASPRAVRTPTVPQSIPNYPYRAFDLDFLFPLARGGEATASGLFRLGVDLLGAEYGYYFVRDDLCCPSNYAWGMGSPLDYSLLERDDAYEVGEWRDFVREGRLWTSNPAQLRDLFSLNLLSERHLSTSTRLGRLSDWIVGGPGRGRLDEIRNGSAFWSLSDAEIHAVRPILNEAALLRSCRPRYYRDLPINQQRPDPGLRPHRLNMGSSAQS
jgi:hypothetical protein